MPFSLVFFALLMLLALPLTADPGSPEGLAGMAGLVLSLAATYIPGLNSWYAGLKTEAKQGIMGVMIVVVGTASAFWACQDPAGVCVDGLNWKTLAVSIFSALVMNQATDRVSPEPAAVKEAKAEAKAEESPTVARLR